MSHDTPSIRHAAVLLALIAPTWLGAQDESAPASSGRTGQEVFEMDCAVCHRSEGKSMGPKLEVLREMSAEQIHFALTEGKMSIEGEFLSPGEIEAVVDYLAPVAAAGDQPASETEGTVGLCADDAVSTGEVAVGYWGLDASNSRFQAATSITPETVGRLELAWSFGLGKVTEARAQPVITADTVFVVSVIGQVFALDRETGCTKWQHQTGVPLRTALTLGKIGDRPALYFGDGTATVHAIDARDGTPIWKQKVGLHPASITTGAILHHGDRLYVPLSAYGVALAMNPKYECCKSHGAVLALDADSGEILWTTHMTEEAKPTYENSIGVQQWGPSGIPVWASPALDAERGVLYVGTGENTSTPWTEYSDSILALDIENGEIQWAFQATDGDAFNMACGRSNGPNCPKEKGPDFDFGASPVLTSTPDGRRLLIAGQKSGTVHALDPATGEVVWQRQLSEGTALGGVHWGLAVDEQRVFVPIADPEFPRPGYEPKPGIHALDKATGEVLWSHRAERGCEVTRRPGGGEAWPECSFYYGFSAAATAAPGLVFAPSLDGVVHAFAADDGEELWSYDTVEEYTTVNGLEAHGGATDNAGVQLAGDMLFVQSGYGMFGQMPGNVLLAFRLRSE